MVDKKKGARPNLAGYAAVNNTDLEVGEWLHGEFRGIKQVISTTTGKPFHVIAVADAERGPVTMTAGAVLFARLCALQPSIGESVYIERVKDLPSAKKGRNPARNFDVRVLHIEGLAEVPYLLTSGQADAPKPPESDEPESE